MPLACTSTPSCLLQPLTARPCGPLPLNPPLQLRARLNAPQAGGAAGLRSAAGRRSAAAGCPHLSRPVPHLSCCAVANERTRHAHKLPGPCACMPACCAPASPAIARRAQTLFDPLEILSTKSNNKPSRHRLQTQPIPNATLQTPAQTQPMPNDYTATPAAHIHVSAPQMHPSSTPLSSLCDWPRTPQRSFICVISPFSAPVFGPPICKPDTHSRPFCHRHCFPPSSPLVPPRPPARVPTTWTRHSSPLPCGRWRPCPSHHITPCATRRTYLAPYTTALPCLAPAFHLVRPCAYPVPALPPRACHLVRPALAACAAFAPS